MEKVDEILIDYGDDLPQYQGSPVMDTNLKVHQISSPKIRIVVESSPHLDEYNATHSNQIRILLVIFLPGLSQLSTSTIE